jgi:hypothetical protein
MKFRDTQHGDTDSEMILRQQLLRLTYENDQYKRACERLKEQMRKNRDWVAGGMSTNRSLGIKPIDPMDATQKSALPDLVTQMDDAIKDD